MNLTERARSIGLTAPEYRALMALFLDTSIADLEQMKCALQAKDCRMVSHTAHALNGAAANLGLTVIRETARQIEQAASDDRLDAVSDQIAALERHLDAIPAVARDDK